MFLAQKQAFLDGIDEVAVLGVFVGIDSMTYWAPAQTYVSALLMELPPPDCAKESRAIVATRGRPLRQFVYRVPRKLRRIRGFGVRVKSNDVSNPR